MKSAKPDSNERPSDNAALKKKLDRALRKLDWTAPKPQLLAAAESVQVLGPEILPLLLADLGGTNRRKQKSAEGFWALGAHAASAIPELEQRLEQEPHYVAFALVGIGPMALPAILRALSHPKPPVRSGTAKGIKDIASRLPLDDTIAEQLVPALIDRFNDEDAIIQRDAISAIGRIRRRPAQCVPLLLEFLVRSKGHCLDASMFALSRFGDEAKAAIPLIQDMTHSEDSTLRFFAVRSLAWGWPSDEHVVSCLLECLTDPDRSVRGEAAFGLGSKCQHLEVAIPALIEFLRAARERGIGLATGLCTPVVGSCGQRSSSSPFAGPSAEPVPGTR